MVLSKNHSSLVSFTDGDTPLQFSYLSAASHSFGCAYRVLLQPRWEQCCMGSVPPASLSSHAYCACKCIYTCTFIRYSSDIHQLILCCQRFVKVSSNLFPEFQVCPACACSGGGRSLSRKCQTPVTANRAASRRKESRDVKKIVPDHEKALFGVKESILDDSTIKPKMI